MKHFVAIAFALIAYFLVIGVKSAPLAQIPANSQEVNEGDNSGSANSSNQSLFPPEETCVRRVSSSLNAQSLSFRNDSDTKVSCSVLKEHLQNAKNCLEENLRKAKNCPDSSARERFLCNNVVAYSGEIVYEIDRFVLFFCSKKEMVVSSGPGWFTGILNFFGF